MTPKYLLLVFLDKGLEWRWQMRHRNGRVIADSGEGYSSKSGAVRAARRLSFVAAEAMLQTRKA